MALDIAALYRHGGRLGIAEAAFPAAPKPWLDLSTGINPEPWRGERAPDSALHRLPDPADIGRLEVIAARVFGADMNSVTAVPGSEAAIRLLPRLLSAKSVVIVGLTYSSHEAAWRAAGREVHLVDSLDAAIASDGEAIVVVNPNNPDGRIIPPEVLLKTGRLTIIDEAFADLTPKVSIAAKASDQLIALRSFGKFYGLPGARLGFVIAGKAFTQTLQGALGDWAVSADAVALGLGAYADDAWAQAAWARLTVETAAMDDLLTTAGYEIVGGTGLFRLARHADAAGRFIRLCERGVLVRPFEDRPDLLRFGLPPQWEWKRLEDALR